MFRKAKLIKLPLPLVAYSMKEFKLHFGYLLKNNLSDTNKLGREELDFLSNNGKAYQEFYSAFPTTLNLREIWENYVDAADSLQGYEPKILKFKEYEDLVLQNRSYTFLKKHTMEILNQQKKMISNASTLYGNPAITSTLSLPEPFYATPKKCESKPFVITTKDLVGMPYITSLPKDYKFSVRTEVLPSSDSDGEFLFYPSSSSLILNYKITEDTLRDNPIYYLNHLDEITEHEMTHFVQYLMKDITSISSWGDIGNAKGTNTAWQDLPIEYKAIFRDQFVLLGKMRRFLDLSSYSSFLKSVNNNIKYLPKIESIRDKSPEKFTPFMTQLFVLLRK